MFKQQRAKISESLKKKRVHKRVNDIWQKLGDVTTTLTRGKLLKLINALLQFIMIFMPLYYLSFTIG